MTKAVYLMARLTAKGIQPGMPFGGIPDLTKTDIAACCAGLNALIHHLLMAKYCNDVHSAIQALGELQEFVCKKSKPVAEMDPVKRMVLCAYLVDDFVSARKCKRCKGTGRQLEESSIIECKRCGGTGSESSSLRERAGKIGIPKSTFSDAGLNAECEYLEKRLIDMEMAALAKIARRAS